MVGNRSSSGKGRDNRRNRLKNLDPASSTGQKDKVDLELEAQRQEFLKREMDREWHSKFTPKASSKVGKMPIKVKIFVKATL